MSTHRFDWKGGYLPEVISISPSGERAVIPPHAPRYSWKDEFTEPVVVSQEAYNAAVADVSAHLADYTPQAVQRQRDHRPHLGRDAFNFIAGAVAVRREGLSHYLLYRCESRLVSALEKEGVSSPHLGGAVEFPLALAFSEFLLVDEASRLANIVLEQADDVGSELSIACSDHGTVQDLARRSHFIDAFQRQKLTVAEATTIVLSHKHNTTPDHLYSLATPRVGIFPDLVTEAWRRLAGYRERIDLAEFR